MATTLLKSRISVEVIRLSALSKFYEVGGTSDAGENVESNGFANRCTDETALSAGSKSVRTRLWKFW
jgi:hypothetical protein